MLKYVVKDLIQAAKDGDCTVIAHCCNCFNNMGAGIAPLIAKEFPIAKKIDQLTLKGDKKKLGTSSCGWDHDSDTLVYNLYGQYGFNRHKKNIDYDALRSALASMRNQVLHQDTIGLPKLGAGLAGGDWKVISKIIEEELTTKGFNVTIYVLTESEIPNIKEGI